MCELAKQHGVVLIVPMYEVEQPGVYYNTAGRDRRGRPVPRQANRKNHIPQVQGFWEKFYFRPGNLGYPVFDTAVGRIRRLHLLRAATSRKAGGHWGLAGARDRVQTRRRPGRGPVAVPCGDSSSPAAAVSRTSTSSARSTGVGVEPLGDNDFYGQTYFVDPRGQLVGEAGVGHEGRGSWCATLTWGTLAEVRGPVGVSTGTVRPETYSSLVQG